MNLVCVRHSVVSVKRLMYKEYMIAFDTTVAAMTSNVSEMYRMQVRGIATIAPVMTKVVGVTIPQLVVKQIVSGAVN
ncbi:MAG: hypothetical protein H8D23_40790 [Candidatus Brocadiales bacterium]|nr:hypothetical protein [Candidatus Brocadiales bacterium]